MEPYIKITKKFTKKFGSKIINKKYFQRKTRLNYLYVMTKIGNIYNRAQFTELLIHVLAMNYDKIAVTLQHSNSGRGP